MKRKFALVVLCLAAAVGMVICGGGRANAAESEDPIIIGVIAPFTGETSLFGNVLGNTVNMLAEKVNAEGGLLGGRKLVVKTYDNRDDIVETTNAARKAIQNDKVIAFLGTDSSGSSIALGDVCADNKVPMITHVGTNSRVTLSDSGKLRDWAFRACMADPQQGSILGTYAYETLKHRNVAVIYNIGNDYSLGIRDAFSKAFVAAGGTITIEESHNVGDVDFRAQISKIKANGNYDAVFLAEPFYKEVGLLVKQMRDLGVDAPILSTEAVQVKDILNITGDAMDGCYFVIAYDIESSRVDGFVKEFTEKWGYDPTINVPADAYLAHDAFRMLVRAIEESGDAAPDNIRKALNGMQDIEGLTCNFSVDADTHYVLREVVIYRWGKDSFEAVERLTPTHVGR